MDFLADIACPRPREPAQRRGVDRPAGSYPDGLILDAVGWFQRPSEFPCRPAGAGQ
jgi:hypothetical protein